MASPAQNPPPKKATTVKFARKTSSGRYVSLSRDDIDAMINHTVHHPPTPDNQPMDEEASVTIEATDHLESGAPFCRIPRPPSKKKAGEPEVSHSQMTDASGSACAMPDCNGTVMRDAHGNDILPCECRLLIVIRFVALILFLTWRVKHPNEDAIWLWAMSVVCEIWFAFSWILDQLPKLNPVNRSTDLSILHEKFETRSPLNPNARSDLPGVDVFVSTADPEKEPPLVTSNTILSILAADYPVEKLACYVSDDGGALLTFEAMAEAASFAAMWVPFCRKHNIEPRNPDSYFGLKRDPTKNKMRSDFVKDRRKVKREYDEFKVRINGLPDAIRRRSDAFNAREEMKILRKMKESGEELEPVKSSKATWMADGMHWPGTWTIPVIPGNLPKQLEFCIGMNKATPLLPVVLIYTSSMSSSGINSG